MKKENFPHELHEIIEDTLFIGNSVDDLYEEVDHNMWYLSMGQEMATGFTVEEWEAFFQLVMANREAQIQANGSHGMLFYLWFDAQAVQLRFNLISDCHTKLPFGCAYEALDRMEPILTAFRSSLYHNGIPIDEWEDEEEELEEPEEEHENYEEENEDDTLSEPLLVYVKHLL